MNNPRQPFRNPYEDADNYIFLGTADYADHTQSKVRVIYRDLYAITHLDSKYYTNRPYIDFGCRFSDEPSDYASGSADRSYPDKRWGIIGGGDIALAAARYFANYHSEK